MPSEFAAQHLIAQPAAGESRLGAAAPPAPSAAEIRAQCERIVASPSFATSDRPRRFLTYIVEQTLAGEGRRLKQYGIATEVLGRPSDFNPETDPIVRLEAGKLRRAIENYYLREGGADPVVVTIPKGTYVPHFSWADRQDGRENPPESAGQPSGTVAWLAKPSTERLAILPFTAAEDEERCGTLSQGLFDEIVVETARYRDVTVVTPPKMTGPSDSVFGLIEAADAARARFILSGSIRHSDGHVRITVRLHDAAAGAILWTDSFDGNLADEPVMALQTRLARHIAGTVADFYGVISRQVTLEAVYAADQAWTVNSAVQRHRYLARTLSESAYRQARPDLDRAVEAAPHHPLVWAALGHTVFYGNVLGFEDEADWLSRTERCAQRAFELDHRCAWAHIVAALVGLYRGELDEVLERSRLILSDNPHAPSTRVSAGFFSCLAGDFTWGLPTMQEALAQLVHPPAWPYRAMFLDAYRVGDYAGALRALGKFNSPESITPPVLRAAALGQLGRLDEAAAAVAEVRRICPRFSAIAHRFLPYLVSIPDLSAQVHDGLRKAGLLR